MARTLPDDATLADRIKTLTRGDLSDAAKQLSGGQGDLSQADGLAHALARALLPIAKDPVPGLLADGGALGPPLESSLSRVLSVATSFDSAAFLDDALRLALDDALAVEGALDLALEDVLRSALALSHPLDLAFALTIVLDPDLALDRPFDPGRSIDPDRAIAVDRALNHDVDLARDLALDLEVAINRLASGSLARGRQLDLALTIDSEPHVSQLAMWGAIRVRAWWYEVLIAWAVSDRDEPTDSPDEVRPVEPPLPLEATTVPSKASVDQLADAAEAVLRRATLEYSENGLWKDTLDEPNIESWIRTLRDELYRPGGDDGNRDYWTIERFSLRLQHAVVQRCAEVEQEEKARQLLQELRERVLDPLSKHEPESDETESAESVAAFFAEHLDPEELELPEEERERWAALSPEETDFARRGVVYELLGWSSGNTYGSAVAVGAGVGGGSSALAGIVATSLANAASLAAIGTGIGGLAAVVLTFAAKRLQTGWRQRGTGEDETGQ